MKQLTILLACFLILLGCKKANPVPVDIAFIEGDYEWSNSGSIDDSKDSYGITIDKKRGIYTHIKMES